MARVRPREAGIFKRAKDRPFWVKEPPRRRSRRRAGKGKCGKSRVAGDQMGVSVEAPRPAVPGPIPSPASTTQGLQSPRPPAPSPPAGGPASGPEPEPAPGSHLLGARARRRKPGPAAAPAIFPKLLLPERSTRSGGLPRPTDPRVHAQASPDPSTLPIHPKPRSPRHRRSSAKLRPGGLGTCNGSPHPTPPYPTPSHPNPGSPPRHGRSSAKLRPGTRYLH